MSGVTDTLNSINGVIQLATVVEGVALPVIVGVVKDVKAFLNAGGEIEYTVVITTGHQNVQDTLAATTDSLTKINAERVTAGLPPLAIPGQ